MRVYACAWMCVFVCVCVCNFSAVFMRDRERERGIAPVCLCVAQNVTPSVFKLLNVARYRNLLGKICFILSASRFSASHFFAYLQGPIKNDRLSVFKKPKHISPISACLQWASSLTQTHPGVSLSCNPHPTLMAPYLSPVKRDAVI